jgi:hypothetical protein
MTDQNADFAMKYRVTFIVDVTDPELLLRRAREMDAEMEAILGGDRPGRIQPKNYDPETIDSIEEALCWVLPNGRDDEEQSFDIIDAEAVVIGEVI